MSENVLLRLKSLEKSFDRHPILRGISLDVQSGEFVTLLGPSGCGKTTTLRIIAGLLDPDAGSVELDGRDITALAPEKRDVNTVFQNYALFPHMNVEKNISYGLRVRGMKKPEWQQRVAEMLRLVQLEGYEKRMPGQLSGGQRQRVAIARAMSLNPSAIIADEPTSALDVSVRAQILNLLTDLKKDLGLSMMFISHDIQTVRYISDKIIVMNHGQIMEQGPAKQVFENPQDPYTKLLLGAAPSLLHPKLGE